MYETSNNATYPGMKMFCNNIYLTPVQYSILLHLILFYIQDDNFWKHRLLQHYKMLFTNIVFSYFLSLKPCLIK